MNNSLSLISLVIPGILALTSCASRFTHKSERDRIQFILFGNISAVVACLSLAISNFASPAGGESAYGLLRYDSLSAILLPVICTISCIVAYYNARYLQGDAHRVRLMSRMALLTASAVLLVLSNSIITFAICWCLISIALRECISSRNDANRVSKSVLRYHQASDVLMLLAAISLVALGGTDTFSSLPVGLSVVSNAHKSGISPTDLVGIALVVSFAIKSALFPFHRWLLSTLEAPTTLSALLHAGVVNVSAIAAARFFPVLEHSLVASLIWTAISLLSAVAGTLSMAAQFDVKRKLVYSTVGQMGFMSLQCALGMVPLAIFHLIAHSAFKSHLFLQAGSTVEESLYKRKWSHDRNSSSGASASSTALGLIFLAVAGYSFLNYDMSSWTTGIASLTAALYLFKTTGGRAKGGATMITLTAAIIIAAAAMSRSWLEQLLTVATSTHLSSPSPLMPIVTLSLLLLGLIPVLGKNSTITRILYVHGLNGFYIDKVTQYCVKMLSGNRPKVKLEVV